MTDKTIISIVLAVRNEERIIEGCLHSLLAQKLNESYSLELLVIDGLSTDNTASIVRNISEKHPNQVILIPNEKKITPVAFNLGIGAATGDYIGIFGAHSEYANNYIQTCVDQISEMGADGCSGLVISKMTDDSSEAELCNQLLSSPIGVSGNSFRTRGSGFAETIPYGIFKREVFEAVGPYNEALIRNQDNDMNYRINKKGFRLFITDKTHADYFPKQRLKPLMNYAFNTGFWNARTLVLGSFSMRLMHFIPFFFVLYILLILLFIIGSSFMGYGLISLISLFPLLLYFGLVHHYNKKNEFRYKENFNRFFSAIFKFHWNYGLGTLLGFFNVKIKS